MAYYDALIVDVIRYYEEFYLPNKIPKKSQTRNLSQWLRSLYRH